ncbi:B12-binding domain-containing radical SAM protein [Candidatus Deferrimicrobium sp.]|uniref:B12-binding domain-containing radical SAM protein n=1 Tax=Candidatus Deferrimicrobium sp. TaxID=3060586 RepID=UPI002ED50517
MAGSTSDLEPELSSKAANGRDRILLIELSSSVTNLGRFMVMPRFGMLAIASILAEKTRYRVKLLFEPYVGPITPESVASENPRYVMLNGLTTASRENEIFVDRFRELTRGTVPVITGGEHASMFPEKARRYSDFIFVHEGDEGVLALLEALEQRDPLTRDSLLSRVAGLHYRGKDGAWKFNDGSERIQEIDFRYDLSVVEGAEHASKRFRTACMPVQTSRGCIYCCSFCSWLTLYGKSGYYVRAIDDVIHDIVHTIEYTGIRDFIVTDNLFAGDPAYAEELAFRLMREFEGRETKPRLTVLMRADQFAGGPGSLSDRRIRMLSKAGIENVSLGLESTSSRSLLQMNKKIDLARYYLASERLRKHGIGMLGTFVAGFDGDTYEDVVNLSEFGHRFGLFTIQVYARTIMPGSTDDLLSAHRNIPDRLDRYYNGHGVCVLPGSMLPSDLQRGIFEAEFRFHRMGDGSRKLALRAFQSIWAGMRPHYEALQRIEREILVPEGIYRERVSGVYTLQNKALDSLYMDEERYRQFRSRCATIFREAEPAIVRTPVPVPQADAASLA